MFFDDELVRINTEKLLKEAEYSRLVSQEYLCTIIRLVGGPFVPVG